MRARRVTAGIASTLAVAGKELRGLIRQPWLVLALIAGPLLILGVFGAGFDQTVGPLETIVVVDDDSPLRGQIADEIDAYDALVLVDIGSDRRAAIARVDSGSVDLAIIVPARPATAVRSGERATFELIHDTLDPFDRATISLLAQATIDAANRSVLARVVERAQERGRGLVEAVSSARENAARAAELIDEGEFARARERIAAANEDVEPLRTARIDVLSLYDDLGGAVGDDLSVDERVQRIAQAIDDVDTNDLTGTDADRLRTAVEDLRTLQGVIEDYGEVSPDVLVSPLSVDTDVATTAAVTVTGYYAPGVLALLLQHLAITLASLSLVAERRIGSIELFRVAPMRPWQLLTGKYVAFAAIVALVASGLTAGLVAFFDLPIGSSMGEAIAILALLSLASLGVGFVVSSFVRTDLQAVNVTMFILLISVFFSGFVLSIERLVDAVQPLAWALPITHAVDAMRALAFRGESPSTGTWVTLGALAVGGVLVTLVRLRAELASSRP